MSSALDQPESQPRAAKRPPYSPLLDAPDQDRVRTDLATFFGPNADVYLAVYEKMRAAEGPRRAMVRTWSWPVFFGSFTWFFYRKLYAYGAVLILVPIVLGYLLGSSGGAIAIVFAMFAKGQYVQMALARIAKADQLGLSGAERSDYLQRAGGVSVSAGAFAGFVYVCLLALVIIAAVYTPAGK